MRERDCMGECVWESMGACVRESVCVCVYHFIVMHTDIHTEIHVIRNWYL